MQTFLRNVIAFFMKWAWTENSAFNKTHARFESK